MGPVAHPFRQDAIPNTTSARVARAQRRRDHCLRPYERAAQLHAHRHSVAATARLTGVGCTTLQGWFKTPHFPGQATRPGAILPFLNVVRDRATTAEFTGKQIYDELAVGIPGPSTPFTTPWNGSVRAIFHQPLLIVSMMNRPCQCR